MTDRPTRRRAAFLDRDGVINIDHGYVFRREDFEFVPGVLDGARRLADLGYALVVVTNQSGIGRGLYGEGDFLALTEWMKGEFAQAGAPLAGVYYCPHHPTEANGAYRIECACRKPGPGMLMKAAKEFNLDLATSIMFGDRASDLQAAKAAGVGRRVMLATDGRGAPAEAPGGLATARYVRLDEAVLAEFPQAKYVVGDKMDFRVPDFETKVVTADQLAERAKSIARPLVFTNGVFDILHRGHVTYLAQARSLGAALIVAVNSDSSVRMLGKGGDRPLNRQQDRSALLAALQSVDLVTVFDEREPLHALRVSQPDIYVKGGDYDMGAIPESALVRSWGGTCTAIPFEHHRSTTSLINRIRAGR